MSKAKRTCQDDFWANEDYSPTDPNSDDALIDKYTLNRIKSQEDVARQLMLINATLLGIFIAFSKDTLSVTAIKENIRYLQSLSLSPFLSYLINLDILIYISTIIVLIPIFCWIGSLFISYHILKKGYDPEKQLKANKASEYLNQISQEKDKSMKLSYNLMFAGLCWVILFFSFTYFYSISYNVIGGEVITFVNNGNSLVKLGEYEKAIKLYDEAIEINPILENAWNGKGNALTHLGKYDDAINAFERAIQINQNLSIAWLGKGGALSSKCMYNEAIKCYNKTLEIDPNNLAALSALNAKGVDLNYLGMYSEANQLFDYVIHNKTVSDDTTLSYLWINKGDALEGLGKYSESIEAYNEAINIRPRYARAWSDKARVLSLLGNFNESRLAVNKTIEYSPHLEETLKEEGLNLCKYGGYENAIKDFDDAIRINPQNATIWNYKGAALYYLGRYNESILAYNEAIELNPQFALAWNNKGTALKKIGRSTEAEEATAKAKEFGYKS